MGLSGELVFGRCLDDSRRAMVDKFLLIVIFKSIKNNDGLFFKASLILVKLKGFWFYPNLMVLP